MYHMPWFISALCGELVKYVVVVTMPRGHHGFHGYHAGAWLEVEHDTNVHGWQAGGDGRVRLHRDTPPRDQLGSTYLVPPYTSIIYIAIILVSTVYD